MMMQLSKKIPFDDPDVLMVIRVVYVVSNIIIFGVYLYLQKQVEKKKGMSRRSKSMRAVRIIT